MGFKRWDLSLSVRQDKIFIEYKFMETLPQKLCYLTFGARIPLLLQYIVPGIILFNPIRKLLKLHWVRIILIALPFLFFFSKILRNDPFFFSDDFAHLNLSANFSYIEIYKMAMSSQGIWVGHRIIFGFWLFKLLFNFFSTNPIPYYWLMFFINLGNGILLYILASKILLNKKVAALIAFIFGFFYVTWLSNIHEVLGLMFTLLTFICFFSWQEKFKIKTFLFSIIFYIFAVFTKEITFLAVPVMFLMAIVSKKNLKKNIKYLLVFLFIFVLYSLFYAKGFISYFNVPQNTGYNMSLSIPNIVQNINVYLGQVFPTISNKLTIYFLLAVFIIFDLCHKKLKSLPFLVSYIIFLSPALLFTGRTATYYNYIPIVFLLLGFGVVIEGLIKSINFIRNKNLKKIISVSFVILFIFGLMGINLKMMDTCFLIQYPWNNYFKDSYIKLINNINNTSDKKIPIQGLEIKLDPTLDYPSEAMEDISIKTFLNNPGLKRYTYTYSAENKSVIIK